jgi:hypothetical protein
LTEKKVAEACGVSHGTSERFSGRTFAHGSDLTTICSLSNLPALMQSREGRCGEFANLFTLFLVAVGLDARYVWNSEDHVWSEYWSDSLGHWVHLDPCEAAWNKPLLYELGWGKKQAYCIAVGRSGIEDVSRCYVDDWSACWDRRRRFDEEDLSEVRHNVQCALIQALLTQVSRVVDYRVNDQGYEGTLDRRVAHSSCHSRCKAERVETRCARSTKAGSGGERCSDGPPERHEGVESRTQGARPDCHWSEYDSSRAYALSASLLAQRPAFADRSPLLRR